MSLIGHRCGHGSGVERRRSLCPHAVCVPGVLVRGRGAATDLESAGSHQPGRHRLVPQSGVVQLLFHL